MAITIKTKMDKKPAKTCPDQKKKPAKSKSVGNKGAGTKAVKKGVKGFLPGKSGNPDGRPHGSRNKATLAMEAMLDGQSEAITKKCINMALEGDTTALRLAMDRLVPPRKSRPVALELPDTQTTADILKAYDAVIKSTSQGELTPEEARQFFLLFDAKRKAIETVELSERLEKIEAQLELDE